MMRYVVFKKYYNSRYANYKFFPNVKYMLKDENSKYYFTIKGVRLPKKEEYKIYEVNTTIWYDIKLDVISSFYYIRITNEKK